LDNMSQGKTKAQVGVKGRDPKNSWVANEKKESLQTQTKGMSSEWKQKSWGKSRREGGKVLGEMITRRSNKKTGRVVRLKKPVEIKKKAKTEDRVEGRDRKEKKIWIPARYGGGSSKGTK